jgi:hypothetical protein
MNEKLLRAVERKAKVATAQGFLAYYVVADLVPEYISHHNCIANVFTRMKSAQGSMWSSAGPENSGLVQKDGGILPEHKKVAMGVLDSRAEWNLCDFVINPAAVLVSIINSYRRFEGITAVGNTRIEQIRTLLTDMSRSRRPRIRFLSCDPNFLQLASGIRYEGCQRVNGIGEKARRHG